MAGVAGPVFLRPDVTPDNGGRKTAFASPKLFFHNIATPTMPLKCGMVGVLCVEEPPAAETEVEPLAGAWIRPSALRVRDGRTGKGHQPGKYRLQQAGKGRICLKRQRRTEGKGRCKDDGKGHRQRIKAVRSFCR